jgi:glycosyltransferase involved in cell wall biosynthesis
VLGTLEAGGAERFVVDLVCELRARGWDAELVVLGTKDDAAGREMAQRLAAAAVPLHRGPSDSIRARSVLWYVRTIRDRAPDILHLHNLNTEVAQMFVPPPWQPRRGLARTIHTVSIERREMEWFSFRMNAVSQTIFCSQASLEQYRKLVRGEARVVQNGIRFTWPIRTPERASEARARLGLASDRLHFLHVGRMGGERPEKSPKAHDVLIRAWQASGLGRSEAELHLLGDGNLRPTLEALCSARDGIVMHGVRSDVHEWLLAADAFVMPSRWEGLPMAGIEAVATGLPCLFSDIAPLRELAPPAAIWCPSDDPDALANGLRELAALPPPGVAQVEATRERFGIARAAAEYEKAYAEMAP